MKIFIAVHYQKAEDISDLLDTISKAVDAWEENYPNLCEHDSYSDGIEVHLQPIAFMQKYSV